MPKYDTRFFDHTARLTETSATHVTRTVMDLIPVRSILDVGCAEGVWLRAWQVAGVEDFLGLDGDYVDLARLRIPVEHFSPVNLAEGFDLGRTFDLVQSLEVAEHIPEAAAERFVASLAKHGDIILFSAAPPGQGGRNHINEQPYDYWRDKFAAHGFMISDGLRDRWSGMADIAPWYRYNTFLYFRSGAIEKLPPTLRECIVPDGTPLRDISATVFKIRKMIFRLLPYALTQALARLATRGK